MISSTSFMLKKFEKEFDGIYEIKPLALGTADLLTEVGSFEPDIIFFYAEALRRPRLFPLMDLRDNSRFSKIPMLLMADEETANLVCENVNPPPDFTMPSDISGINVIKYVDRMLAATAKKKIVLAVDDDLEDLKKVRDILNDKYKVTCVKSGFQALKFLEVQKPDCIILDYMMPQMDGVQTMAYIRRLDPRRTIPVIFLTGQTNRETIMKCLSTKPGGLLLKPVQKEQLVKKLEELV